jgi:NADPH:quinone reductase-like Zn-dependent oxidoreductase
LPTGGWARVRVKAAALNQHDVWSLRGVGLSADELPRVLGCDAAGLDDEGNEVVVHGVIGDPDAGRGDETKDPNRSLLSERFDGALAEFVVVPARNLVPKPADLSFEEACADRIGEGSWTPRLGDEPIAGSRRSRAAGRCGRRV